MLSRPLAATASLLCLAETHGSPVSVVQGRSGDDTGRAELDPFARMALNLHRLPCMPEPHGHDIAVIGASAGGIDALGRPVYQLPADTPAAVLVVLHVSAGATSVLPAILNRHDPLHAAHPRAVKPLEHGRICVAPPDHHLAVEPGRVLLTRGPRENRVRPAVDAASWSCRPSTGADARSSAGWW